MAVLGVGATPQPEERFDPIKKREEEFANSLFNNLDGDGNGVIDKKDGVDSSMLSALKTFVGKVLTLDAFKKVAGRLYDFTYTKTGKYNGKDAQITYNIWGKIRSVNTGAQNVSEARTHMGLDKEHVVKVSCVNGKEEDMLTYGREYEENNGTKEEYFVWNPQTKSMDFEWGAWGRN